jgi:uncharacterized protein (TIGR03437 family)
MRRFTWGALLFVVLPAVRAQIGTLEIEDRTVTYEILDGYAVTHGDLLLGRAEELNPGAESSRARQTAAYLFGTTSPARWTNGVMHYIVDPDVPDQNRIMGAIQQWNDRTPLKVEPRTGQANYVRFRRSSSGCNSFVGMLGGEQVINLTDNCSTLSVAHEIGHAFGLWHEQERNDRNAFVTLALDNIDPRFLNNFDQSPNTVDVGYYDFDSVMQYFSNAFSRSLADTIETVPIGIPVGQRSTLSAGDIDGASRLYGIIPTTTTITTIPAGLAVNVDGADVVSPHSFAWAPGTVHTISVPAEFGTDPRYRLVRWSDSGAPSHTITASSDVTVFAAVFQRLHPVSTSIGFGTGTATLVPRSSDGYYPERLPLRITGTPVDTFFNWSGTPNLASLGYGLATADAVVQVAVPNARFTANFTTSRTTTFLSDPPGLRVIVDGTSYTTPIKFTFAAGSAHSVAVTQEQSDISGEKRFRFAGWSDGGEPSHMITGSSTGNATYTARFNSRFLLTSTATGGGSVGVSPSSADGYYDAGTEVQLTATPSFGGELRYWTGDLSGGGASRALVMNGPKFVTARFGSPLAFTIFNGASFALNPNFTSGVAAVVPLEMVTIFSALAIGPESLVTFTVDASGRFATSLGGTRILFDGVPAPLVYVSPNAVSAIVPGAVSGRSATMVQIERNGQVIATQTFAVVRAFPSMFTSNATGKGQIAALNENGTINSGAAPSHAGQVIVIYATGGGDMNSLIPDGHIADLNLVGVREPVYVRVGKLAAEVIYAGSAPGIVNGAFQVNAILPAELLPNPATPIQLIVGNYVSPAGTTIAVE